MSPTSFLYFAYGSNLLTGRLIDRVSSARFVAKGWLNDYVFRFDKISQDGSAKANLVIAPGSRVPGVLYEIDNKQRKTLDRFEGGYDAHDLQIQTFSGDEVTALVYISQRRDPDRLPFQGYVALIEAGAIEHELGEDFLSLLRRQPLSIDQESTFRSDAFSLLKKNRFKFFDAGPQLFGFDAAATDAVVSMQFKSEMDQDGLTYFGATSNGPWLRIDTDQVDQTDTYLIGQTLHVLFVIYAQTTTKYKITYSFRGLPNRDIKDPASPSPIEDTVHAGNRAEVKIQLTIQ